MSREAKRFSKGKKQFRSVYCFNCKQQKSCGKLDEKKKHCCACYWAILEELEQEGLLVSAAQKTLDDYRSGAIVCKCLGSKKARINITFSDGSGWSKCKKEGCGNTIKSAGHHGVIKNRNDPKFWGLETKEKALCGDCLKDLAGQN